MRTEHHRPSILLYGACGHTARFVIDQLLEQGFTPVLCGRDPVKLEAASRRHGGLAFRVAAAGDHRSLVAAMEGTTAVINAAGPFALTAGPVIEAALVAGVPYLDLAAEPDVVAGTLELYGDRAQQAGLALVPAVGFYGGLGDLLATAALGDWAQADEIALAYSLSSWVPTAGTRTTIEVADKRRGGQRLVWQDRRLALRHDQAALAEWDFPPPVGRQSVTTEFITADVVTLSRHLRTQAIASCMTVAPLKDLSATDATPLQAVDARGRSAQTFLVEARVRLGTQQRRAHVQGQDIYAVTAPLVVQALQRLLEPGRQWSGVVTAGQLGDARSYLQALAPEHLQVSFE